MSARTSSLCGAHAPPGARPPRPSDSPRGDSPRAGARSPLPTPRRRALGRSRRRFRSCFARRHRNRQHTAPTAAPSRRWRRRYYSALSRTPRPETNGGGPPARRTPNRSGTGRTKTRTRSNRSFRSRRARDRTRRNRNRNRTLRRARLHRRYRQKTRLRIGRCLVMGPSENTKHRASPKNAGDANRGDSDTTPPTTNPSAHLDGDQRGAHLVRAPRDERGEGRAVRLRAKHAAPLRAPRRGHRARQEPRGERGNQRAYYEYAARRFRRVRRVFLIRFAVAATGEEPSRAVFVKQGRNQTTATARHRGVVRGLRQERRERGTRRAGSRARARVRRNRSRSRGDAPEKRFAASRILRRPIRRKRDGCERAH